MFDETEFMLNKTFDFYHSIIGEKNHINTENW